MSRGLLLLFVFSLSALVGSINGQTRCGSTRTPNWEAYEESQRRMGNIGHMGRIGYECDGYSGGSGSGSGPVSPVAILVDLFFLIVIVSGVSLGIWCVCVQRQKAINAANLNNVPGQQVVGAHQVAHGTDLKLYPQTNTVHKGDPNYQV